MEYDRLLEDAATSQRLLELITKGRIESLTTHIQRDEILAIDDQTKKNRLLGLLDHAQMVPTRGAVYDVSRYDQSTYGSDEDHRLIDQTRGDRPDRDTEDSLIAATSSADVDVLVTDDNRFIQGLKNANVRCDVIDFSEFKRRLADFS